MDLTNDTSYSLVILLKKMKIVKKGQEYVYKIHKGDHWWLKIGLWLQEGQFCPKTRCKFLVITIKSESS